MGAAQPVAQLDQQLMPVRTLRRRDGLLEQGDRLLRPAQPEVGGGQRQLSLGAQLDRDGPREDLPHQGLRAGGVALMKSELSLCQGQLERRRGVTRILEEVLDWPLQPAGDYAEVLGRRAGAAQLDLIEEGPGEIGAGNLAETEPELLTGLPDALSERVGRTGVVRYRTPRAPPVKHSLQCNNDRLTVENVATEGSAGQFRHRQGRPTR